MLKVKNKKVIALMKDELVWGIMAKFIRLRASTYSYLIDDGSEDEKAKGTKKYVIKRKYAFGKYSNCLEVTQIDYKKNEII